MKGMEYPHCVTVAHIRHTKQSPAQDERIISHGCVKFGFNTAPTSNRMQYLISTSTRSRPTAAGAQFESEPTSSNTGDSIYTRRELSYGILGATLVPPCHHAPLIDVKTAYEVCAFEYCATTFIFSTVPVSLILGCSQPWPTTSRIRQSPLQRRRVFLR